MPDIASWWNGCARWSGFGFASRIKKMASAKLTLKHLFSSVVLVLWGGGCLEGRLETKSHRSPFLPASKGWVSCLCTPRWVQRFAKEWDRTIIFFSLRSRKDWLTAWIDNFQPYSSRNFCRRLFVAHHPKPGPECLSIDDPSSMESSDGFSAMGRVTGSTSAWSSVRG